MWKSLPATKICEDLCDDELVEKDYAIKDPDTTEWEAIPLEVFFDNGRVKFKNMWIEKEQ